MNTYLEKYIQTGERGTTKKLHYIFDAPAITEDILETGDVRVFFSNGNHSSLFPLPVRDYAAVHMDAFVRLGRLNIYVYEPDLADVPASKVYIDEARDLFRYVVIPGGSPL